MADLCLPLSAGEDAFELHSVQLELEAVERQINELLERQAQLRERQTALETSRADAHKSGVSIQRAANTPTTSTPCVSLHRPHAPRTRSSQMSFTPAPGHHGPWVQQQRKTRARPRATTSPPPPAPVFEISTRNRFAPPPRDGTWRCDRRRLHRPARPCYVSWRWSAHTLFPWCSCSLCFCTDTHDPEGRRERAWTTPSCGRRRHWRGTSGAWSRRYAAHRPRRRSSCQDRFPRIDEDTKGSVDCLL